VNDPIKLIDPVKLREITRAAEPENVRFASSGRIVSFLIDPENASDAVKKTARAADDAKLPTNDVLAKNARLVVFTRLPVKPSAAVNRLAVDRVTTPINDVLPESGFWVDFCTVPVNEMLESSVIARTAS